MIDIQLDTHLHCVNRGGDVCFNLIIASDKKVINK